MPFSLFDTWRKARTPGASSSASAASAAPAAVAEDAAPAEPSAAPERPTVEVTRPAVAGCLKYVIDPEVGINIVDLGLVYNLEVDLPRIRLALTMTTPACPMSGHISKHARAILERVRGATDVEVDLVWDPPWSPQMMDPEVGRRHFGGRFGSY